MKALLTCTLSVVSVLFQAAWSQVVEKSVSVPHDFAGQPIPRYEGGLLVAWNSDGSNVRAFDEIGAQVAAFRVSLPEATVLRVGDVAVTSSGQLILAVSAKNPEGQLASVLVWVDKSGKLLRAVRTSPFAAFQITSSADGCLWAAGRVYDAEFKEVPGHDILRKYDGEGRLVKSLLPRDSFRASHWHPARDSVLVAGVDRVGFYSMNASEWIEVRFSGEVSGRWHEAKLPADTILMGGALTAAGEAYLSTYHTVDELGQQAAGTTLFRLDRSSGNWNPIGDCPVTGPWKGSYLLGASGNVLLFYRKSPRGVDFVRLH